MRSLFVLAVCCFTLSAADEIKNLEIGGVARTYKVHVPEGLGEARVPLVMVLHGGGGNADAIAVNTAMSPKADREKFIVVYPEGVGRQPRASTWNVSHCCAFAMTQHSPDVEFLTKVLDEIVKAHAIDPRRVYVTGMSNGGMMSYRMAGALSDRIAAAGIVSGAMFDDQPKPSRPVSVVIFHGTDDPTVPFAGGMSTNATVAASMDAPFWGVQRAFQYWALADGCGGEARETAEGAVTKRDFETCRDHTAVVEYEIHGGVHAWPGGARNPSPGPINATDLIWSFFAAHPQH